MKPILRYAAFCLLASLLWQGCANIMAPTGGARDEKAPEIRERSLADSALNFKGGKITFAFNEFVKLQDVQNQLIISPFTQTPPKVTVHKKRVSIYLPDSLLQPQTTYRLSLGQAVQDIHEGNAYKNLQFTFSTGSYFDSLSVSGRCIDAATGLPDTSVLVLLYAAGGDDSVLIKQKPLYAVKANDGQFRFDNLPRRTFTLYALGDKNGNYRYDGPQERIGFLTGPASSGDTSASLTLYTFNEKESGDSNTKAKPKRLPGKAPAKKPEDKLTYTFSADTANTTKRSAELGQAVRLQFNAALLDVNHTKIRLFHAEIFDDGATISLDTTRQQILIQTDWTPDAVYTLKLLKGFASDTLGRQASPSELSFRTKKNSDYGSITVRCEPQDQHIVQLLKGGQVLSARPMTDTLISFPLLLPDTYGLRILHDENGNGVWDTGQLFGKKKQPERVEHVPQEISIRANWENKVDVRKKKDNPKE